MILAIACPSGRENNEIPNAAKNYYSLVEFFSNLLNTT